MANNLFAYTAPGADFPEYVSINETDGKVVLTARGQGVSGGIASVTLSERDLGEMAKALSNWLINHPGLD